MRAIASLIMVMSGAGAISWLVNCVPSTTEFPSRENNRKSRLRNLPSGLSDEGGGGTPSILNPRLMKPLAERQRNRNGRFAHAGLGLNAREQIIRKRVPLLRLWNIRIAASNLGLHQMFRGESRGSPQ